MLPVIALLGRPNVGKSTLFNRLTRSRDALVASYPGLTRDRQYGVCKEGDAPCLLVDTGGMTGSREGLDGQVAEQALLALSEAHLALFLVDAKDGRTPGDEAIAALLRARAAPCLLVANKMDGEEPAGAADFFALGLGEPHPISARRGSGVKRLMAEQVAPRLAAASAGANGEASAAEAEGIKIAIVGRPNVGKSTLVNQLLGERRVLADEAAGTTRDSIYVPFQRGGKRYTLIDTAGMRRRARVRQVVEKFSALKTLEAIADAQVALLMVDASEGLVEQDLHLLSHILDAGRALALVVNKWDLASAHQRASVKRALDRRLAFIGFASIHFASALAGTGLARLFPAVNQAHASATASFATPRLNQILARAVAEHQPPLARGRRIKLRYAHQGGSAPPTIVIHGNQTAALPAAYRRYLAHRFMAALKLRGTPLRLEFRTGDNPYEGRKNRLSPRQAQRRQRMIKHAKKAGKKG